MTPHPDNDDGRMRDAARGFRLRNADAIAATVDSAGPTDSAPPHTTALARGYEYDAPVLYAVWPYAVAATLDSTGTPEPSPVWATPFDEASYFDHSPKDRP